VGKRNLRREGYDTEDRIVEYLEVHGYRVVDRNFRYSTRAEIDIIARDGEELVFCEVKSRESDEFGPPEYAVTHLKQDRIRRAALAYLTFNGLRDQACRFDVVAVRWRGRRGAIEHLRNAF
jgi:putative endonuclease